MNKKERQTVFDKYGGRCAYCGCVLGKVWHADHIEPAYHKWSDSEVNSYLKKDRGSNSVDNLNPSCPRYNRWKSTWSIEEFRAEISKVVSRLIRDSPQFRLAIDYGLIKDSGDKVKFYYEKVFRYGKYR